MATGDMMLNSACGAADAHNTNAWCVRIDNPSRPQTTTCVSPFFHERASPPPSAAHILIFTYFKSTFVARIKPRQTKQQQTTVETERKGMMSGGGDGGGKMFGVSVKMWNPAICAASFEDDIGDYCSTFPMAKTGHNCSTFAWVRFLLCVWSAQSACVRRTT